MRTTTFVLAAALLVTAAPPGAQTPRGAGVGTVARFARGSNPIALIGDARPFRYMEASGRRAAFLGREDGSFEAWVYPLKVLHGFELSFGTPAYADPIPAANLASSVEIRPETSTVRYAHDSFTADATWLVPIDRPGGVVLLDIHTSVPLEITVKFRIDLKPMWPAALGGQSSYWDDQAKAYVAGEASRKHAALVGSPLALTPPEQPAHNLPDAPSQFTIAVKPDDAASGLVPIAIAASHEGAAAARKIYADLLASIELSYRATEAHYRRLREELTSVTTPDPRIDLAFEWSKVALDKGFVCNPHLGCGLIAGLGPSGTTERPGFGWFFGGDAFMNAWAMTAYGDFATVKRTLEFLRARQRADGKMMHELSQGAGYIRWFEDFPYGYYHADTTPLYIIATRDYVRASGDAAFARDIWPSIRKAYDYCASTDEDGDGLMDNTRAGLAAVETGKLRHADVLTDVYLAAVSTEAAEAAAELATIAGDAFASVARAAHSRARRSLNARFLDDEGKRIYYAWMKSGHGEAETTAWSAVGIWRGVFDASRPAVAGMLDELARPGIAADWGARLLSRESAQYEPQSYNNGAVWPFLSGFAMLALYAQHRADAAWQYLDGTADLALVDGRGFMPELLSGDRLKPLDTAVPHQLFSTSGFASGLIRGLAGWKEPPATEADGAILLEPQLPAGWRRITLRRLHWRDAIFDLTFSRDWTHISATVTHTGRPRPVIIRIAPLPGSRVNAGTGELKFGGSAGKEERRVSIEPGVEIVPVYEPLRVGDPSRRLRVISTSVADGKYVARLEGRRGRRYAVRAFVPFAVASVQGGTLTSGTPPSLEIAVDFPGDGDGWASHDLIIQLGRRLPVLPRS